MRLAARGADHDPARRRAVHAAVFPVLGDRRPIADESDKAWLIRLIKLLEIPVMLAAAAGVLAGNPAVLLALLFVMGIQAAFFGPLKYAILPDILPPTSCCSAMRWSKPAPSSRSCSARSPGC